MAEGPDLSLASGGRATTQRDHGPITPPPRDGRRPHGHGWRRCSVAAGSADSRPRRPRLERRFPLDRGHPDRRPSAPAATAGPTPTARSSWWWSAAATRARGADDAASASTCKSLGWGIRSPRPAPERAAESPGHKLRLVYATAAYDLQAVDLGWIQRAAADRAGAVADAVQPSVGAVADAGVGLGLSRPLGAGRAGRASAPGPRPGPARRRADRAGRCRPAPGASPQRAHLGLGLARAGRRRRSARARPARRSARRPGRPRAPARGAAPRPARSAARRRAPSGQRPPPGDRRRLAARGRSPPGCPARAAGSSEDAARGSARAPAHVGGLALGQLDQRRVGEHRADRPVLAARRCAPARRPARGPRLGPADRAGRSGAAAPRRSPGRARRWPPPAAGTPPGPTRAGRCRVSRRWSSSASSSRWATSSAA